MPIDPGKLMHIRTDPYNYQLDVYHIDRWMCPQCGFILDYQFDDEHPGWPEYDPPPGTIVAQWEDEDEEVQIEYIDSKDIIVRCPRCGLDIGENALIPVTIHPIQNISDIITLIDDGEGLKIELKRDKPHPDSIGKSMAAFANTEGGKIIFGVDNKGNIIGFPEVTTVEGRDKFQRYVRGIASNIQPKVDYQVSFISDQGTHLAIITIPRGRAIYMYNHVFFVRELDSSQPATYDQVIRMFGERTKKG